MPDAALHCRDVLWPEDVMDACEDLWAILHAGAPLERVTVARPLLGALELGLRRMMQQGRLTPEQYEAVQLRRVEAELAPEAIQSSSLTARKAQDGQFEVVAPNRVTGPGTPFEKTAQTLAAAQGRRQESIDARGVGF